MEALGRPVVELFQKPALSELACLLIAVYQVWCNMYPVCLILSFLPWWECT